MVRSTWWCCVCCCILWYMALSGSSSFSSPWKRQRAEKDERLRLLCVNGSCLNLVVKWSSGYSCRGQHPDSRCHDAVLWYKSKSLSHCQCLCKSAHVGCCVVLWSDSLQWQLSRRPWGARSWVMWWRPHVGSLSPWTSKWSSTWLISPSLGIAVWSISTMMSVKAASFLGAPPRATSSTTPWWSTAHR